jgi:uncharacterized membrane protein YeaQ/YmgE (transglycosylase-associated protein family)
MLELFGWDVGMSAIAAFLLVAGALLIGAVPLFIGEVRSGYGLLATAAATLVGGWLGSEAVGGMSTIGPAFEGLYLLTAVLGSMVLGALTDMAVRYLSGGSYTSHPRLLT